MTPTPLQADPNRAPTDYNQTGVVPSIAFDGLPIYREGRAPDKTEIDRRVRAFHEPYHSAITGALQDTGAKLFIDGHAMMGRAPDMSGGLEHRPLAIIGNSGDERGEGAVERRLDDL